MIMPTDTGYLPRLETRANYVDHLKGFTTDEASKPSEGRPKRTRIKTYMLETARDDHAVPALDRLFPSVVHLHRLDDTLYRVEDASHRNRVVGLIESLADGRHPVLYTTLPAAASDKWVRHNVDHNPWLDPELISVLIHEGGHLRPPQSNTSACAKYAEAFRKISFARRNSRFSRRNSFNSVS